MKIDVIFTPLEAEAERFEGRSVVVIDVFRATSCICTAMENGAVGIFPLAGVEESRAKALELREQGYEVVLGGERKMVKIEGFEVDNSPRSYSREVVEGRKVVMSTTNGTRSIELAVRGGGKTVLVGSMLNVGAVVDRLVELGDDVLFFCSGRADRYSVEDTYCAGLMIHLLEQRGCVEELRDVAWVVGQMYLNHSRDGGLEGLMEHNTHYLRLREIGMQGDAEYCLEADVFSTVPEIVEGEMGAEIIVRGIE